MNAKVWFDRWMARHQRINPHALWRQYEGGERDLVYAGWKAAFDEFRVTEELAGLASEVMQRQAERPYPEHQLGWLIGRARLIEGDRRNAAEAIRRREEKARAATEEARLEEMKAAWSGLDEGDREHFRAEVRAALPQLSRLEKFTEVMARNLWAAEIEAHITQRDGA